MKTNRRRFIRAGAAALGTGLAAGLWREAFANPGEPLFPQLRQLGDEFSFVLIADPQVSFSSTRSAVGRTTQKRLSETVSEINAMNRAPVFVVFDGDLVGSVKGTNQGRSQIDNFMTRVRNLRPLSILIHGNHDGSLPWSEFKTMQKELNGTDKALFSWDAGSWHFVALPCNFEKDGEYGRKMLEWLEQDLASNKDRPTMVFEHYHLLPQGLTQLEFYTYEKPFRTELIELLCRHGNVKVVICGHVHNGIKVAQKTAWTYKGVNFITAPTGTASRNFGEEYPEFAAGADQGDHDTGGGYYLWIGISKDRATIKGRLVGVKDEHLFPDKFTAYDNQERLWFRNAVDYRANACLVNGSFEQGLEGWDRPYRYIADENPGFSWAVDSGKGGQAGTSARLFVGERGQRWAKDEMTELYQLVETGRGSATVFEAGYFLDRPAPQGGGYIRLQGYRGRELKLTVLLDWGRGERKKNMRMSSHAFWTATGAKAGPTELIRRGRKREALFWRLDDRPGRWHTVQLDLERAYDGAAGRDGAFRRLEVDKLLVGFGVWCAPDKGARSEAWFSRIRLAGRGDGAAAVVAADGRELEIGPAAFETDFGSGFLGSEE